MLEQVGIITAEEFQAIKAGLQEILTSIEAGTFVMEDHVEDIHSQIEQMLTNKIGDAGKRLHTGRSHHEQSVVWIENYRFMGCGYFEPEYIENYIESIKAAVG